MTAASGGLNVLVVEDEALVAEFIVMAMEESSHRIVGVAETGAEALRLAEGTRPDLALVDILLRGAMNGLDLAQRLREQVPGIRIVFASGSHDPATRAKAEALRPDGFLAKPFLPRHLLLLLDRVSSGRPAA